MSEHSVARRFHAFYEIFRPYSFQSGYGYDRMSLGGMAEWSIATVLKTVGGNPRGFESLSLRRKGGMPF